MEQEEYYFKDVSLLITHYNRSNSLENLLRSFKNLNCSFEDIVVSDDASKPEHIDRIKELQKEYPFTLITTPKNGGLGNNINKGQDAVKTPYTLYVQEDFEPLKKFPSRLKYSLDVMNERQDLDIVRFYSYIRYPYLRPFNEEFSEMYIYPFAANYKKVYYYSDHPHLRRTSFLEKFGRYKEGVSVDRAEYGMCISFIKKKGKGLFYNDFQSLFHQRNSSEEPSTFTRSKWTQSNNIFISSLREVYRQVRYNYDLLF